MRAYKFLAADGHSVFSGVRWPLPTGNGPGPWLEAEPVRACRVGIHACRSDELAYWLNETLWEIELDGEVATTRHKVAAPRGRLVRQIEGYPAAVRALGELCAWRARDRAVVALRSEGFEELADRFESAATIPELAALGPTVDEAIGDGSAVAIAALLAADAAHFARRDAPLVHSPFLAAWAAGHEAAEGAGDDRETFDAAFAAERRFESGWLAGELALA